MLRLFEQAQPVPHDFARRAVVPPRHQPLDERVLLRWKRDVSCLPGSHAARSHVGQCVATNATLWS